MLGYAALAPFEEVEGPPHAQPASDGPAGAAVRLRTGAHQLPVLLGSPSLAMGRGCPLVQDALEARRARLPCASVLVRLMHASAATRDGAGVYARPSYASGAYDSSRCRPRPHELPQYRRLVQRAPRSGQNSMPLARRYHSSTSPSRSTKSMPSVSA